jgi:hypothetical protein
MLHSMRVVLYCLGFGFASSASSKPVSHPMRKKWPPRFNQIHERDTEVPTTLTASVDDVARVSLVSKNENPKMLRTMGNDSENATVIAREGKGIMKVKMIRDSHEGKVRVSADAGGRVKSGALAETPRAQQPPYVAALPQSGVETTPPPQEQINGVAAPPSSSAVATGAPTAAGTEAEGNSQSMATAFVAPAIGLAIAGGALVAYTRTNAGQQSLQGLGFNPGAWTPQRGRMGAGLDGQHADVQLPSDTRVKGSKREDGQGSDSDQEPPQQYKRRESRASTFSGRPSARHSMRG